jgi:hypothetical protein
MSHSRHASPGARGLAAVRVHTLTIAPGVRRPYRRRDWQDTLVIIESGALDLECTHGGVWRFAAGAIIALADLPLRSLRNGGAETLELTLAKRTPGAEPRDPVTLTVRTRLDRDLLGST